MRFAGIDVGSERHTIAVVNEYGEPLHKSLSITEDAIGYRQLRDVLGDPTDCLVAMEAPATIGRICSLPSRPRVSPSPCSTLYAPDALLRRSCRGPRPTTSTPSASPASPPRRSREQLHCPIKQEKSCANSSTYASSQSSISAIAFAISIVQSI